MDYRTGKCSQCGAEYRVPASFAHNAARCKKCKGVVHLSGPRDTPARSTPDRSTPRAASAGSSPPRSPAAMPAKRVVPKPAAPAPTGDAPPREAAAARAKSERAPEPPARVGTPRAAEEARQPGPEGSGTESSRGRHGERKRAAKQKKTPVGALLAGLGILVVGGGLFLFRETLFGGGSKPTEAAPDAKTTEVTPPKAEGTLPMTEPAREPVQPETTEADDAPVETPAKAEPKSRDPNSINLAGMPDFSPTPDTSAEEWAKMNEWMAEWMDVDAGAAGNRAKLALLKETRKAVPVILNTFKKQDFATREGRSNGDQCQKVLEQICNGNNFDWRYADEAAGIGYDNPDDVWFCKRVVELWTGSWKQAEQSIDAWIRLAKLDEKNPEEAGRLREMFGGQAPAAELEIPTKKDDLEVD